MISRQIRLSKSSRAHIITQNYLPGFLVKHNNPMSWMYELAMNPRYWKSLELQNSLDFTRGQMQSIVSKVRTRSQITGEAPEYEAAKNLMNNHPFLYIKMIKSLEGYNSSITDLNRTSYDEESTIFV